MDRPVDELSRFHRAYYTGFIAVMLVCFSPFKAVTYAGPIAFVVWVLLAAPEGVSRNRLVLVVFVTGAVALFYEVVVAEFLLSNYALAIMTYSAFVPVLVIDSRSLASRHLLEKLLSVTSVMLCVQGVVGTIQAVYGALQSGSFGGSNGDRVAGTIYPHLHPELAFSNPMFAVSMSLMLLASLAHQPMGSRRRTYVMTGMVALVLASVVHVLVFLIAAVMMAMMLTRSPSTRRRSPRKQLLAVLVVIGGLSFVALRDNVTNISSVAQSAFDLDAVGIPRAILLSRVIGELPAEAPYQPFLGLGPGQFSSRASLVASGLYLGGPDTPKSVPFLAPKATSLANDYCFSLLYTVADAGGIVGSSQQPFFSLLSVYTEVGLLGLALLLLVVGRLLAQVQRRARARAEVWFQALLLSAGILFLAFLGVQENYWESPQAIFVGILLLKVLHANVMYGEPGAASSVAS